MIGISSIIACCSHKVQLKKEIEARLSMAFVLGVVLPMALFPFVHCTQEAQGFRHLEIDVTSP